MRMSALAGVALVALPAIAPAQWTITPFAGIYAPANDLASVSDNSGTVTAALEQKTGFALGGSAHRWLSGRAGVEAAIGYVWTDVKARGLAAGLGGFAGSGAQSAHLVLTSARLLLRITPRDWAAELSFGIGPTVIFPGGSAYDETSGVKLERGTSAGGVASVGLDYPLTTLIAARVGAESYLYSTELKILDANDLTNDIDFEPKFQTDFVLSAGLSFTLPARGR